MAGPYLAQKKTLHIKAESTAYTWSLSSPVTADVVPAFDITWTPTLNSYKRKELLPYFADTDIIPADSWGEISFKMYMAGSNAAGTAPLLSRALQGCGFIEVIVGATSVTYTPWSAFAATADATHAQLSSSLLLVEDGIGYGISGAAGDVSFTYEVGQPGIAEFKYRGIYRAPVATSAAAVPGTIYNGPQFTNVGMTTVPSAWAAAEFEKLSIKIGNKFADVKDANTALGSVGCKGQTIIGRDVTGSIDPTLPDPATTDLFAAWLAGTTGVLTHTNTIGSVAGNKHKWNFPRVQYSKAAKGERRGFTSTTLDFDAAGLWGGTESANPLCTLTFT